MTRISPRFPQLTISSRWSSTETTPGPIYSHSPLFFSPKTSETRWHNIKY